MPKIVCSYFIFSFLFFVCSFSFSQKSKQADLSEQNKSISTDSSSAKTKRINLRHANSLEFDKKLGIDAKRLIGNVIFEHEGALMYCDSAYLYSDNSMDAFGNIHIQQGDSIHLYGDFLKYIGNEKKAKVQKNVRLTEKDMTLTTDTLYYSTRDKIANYQTGAKIVNKDNTLTSQYGDYYSSSKDFLFKKDVVLTNPEYVMKCDTLRYNTTSKTAFFLGPTTIKGKENFIYCENGWYNTNLDISQFNKNAYLISKEQKVKSDSLYYDRKQGLGRAFQNVEIIDTVQKINISGSYGEYHETSGNAMVTDKALLREFFEKDTLFLHADTLRTGYEGVRMNDEKKNTEEETKKTNEKKQQTKTKLKAIEPTETDSSKQTTKDKPRIMYAYHKVKFYKPDMQGRCDSLVYTYRDSVMRLYTDPIMWSDKNQMTGEKIELKTSHGKLDKLFIINLAFIISQEDTLKYNQIKGKMMTGYFVNNKMRRVKVEGNGQSIYYPKDGKKMIGVNKADCTDMMIYLKDNQIEKITFIKKPDATLYPINELKPEELLLKGYTWRIQQRPLSVKDIFVW